VSDYELAQIVWNDAVVNSSWSGPSLTLATVHSVGYVLDEDDNAICLAASVSDNGCFNAVMTIPKSCIVNRRALSVQTIYVGPSGAKSDHGLDALRYAVPLTTTTVEAVTEAATDVVDGDGWIPWKSDEDVSPASYGTRVAIRWSNGSEEEGFPTYWDWTTDHRTSIVAYKVVKDSEA